MRWSKKKMPKEAWSRSVRTQVGFPNLPKKSSRRTLLTWISPPTPTRGAKPKTTPIAYSMNSDPDSPGYPMINFCARFFNDRRSMADGITYGKALVSPNNLQLANYNNRAQTFLVSRIKFSTLLTSGLLTSVWSAWVIPFRSRCQLSWPQPLCRRSQNWYQDEFAQWSFRTSRNKRCIWYLIYQDIGSLARRRRSGLCRILCPAKLWQSGNVRIG